MSVELEKIQAKLMSLSLLGNGLKMIGWASLGVLMIIGILHIEQYGLKHLIDVIWLGRSL
jgi:hypothetical protein